MFNGLMGKVQVLLDAAAGVVWRAFERDQALMESLLNRTEAILVTIENKLFRGPRE